MLKVLISGERRDISLWISDSGSVEKNAGGGGLIVVVFGRVRGSEESGSESSGSWM